MRTTKQKLSQKTISRLPPSKRMELEKKAIAKKLKDFKETMKKRRAGEGLENSSTNSELSSKTFFTNSKGSVFFIRAACLK